jgi:hypothetical protein
VSKLLVFTLALIAVTISQALSAPVAIRGGDGSETCLRSALDDGTGSAGVLMCASTSDFRNASFRDADLSGANLSNAALDGADMTGAATSMTSFDGTDLTRVRGLTQKQLDQACGDVATKVRAGLKVHRCGEEFLMAG